MIICRQLSGTIFDITVLHATCELTYIFINTDLHSISDIVVWHVDLICELTYILINTLPKLF